MKFNAWIEDFEQGSKILKLKVMEGDRENIWNVMLFFPDGTYEICENIDEEFLPEGKFISQSSVGEYPRQNDIDPNLVLSELPKMWVEPVGDDEEGVSFDVLMEGTKLGYNGECLGGGWYVAAFYVFDGTYYIVSQINEPFLPEMHFTKR